MTSAQRLTFWWVSYEAKRRWGRGSRDGEQYSYGGLRGVTQEELRKQTLLTEKEFSLCGSDEQSNACKVGEAAEQTQGRKEQNSPSRFISLCISPIPLCVTMCSHQCDLPLCIQFFSLYPVAWLSLYWLYPWMPNSFPLCPRRCWVQFTYFFFCYLYFWCHVQEIISSSRVASPHAQTVLFHWTACLPSQRHTALMTVALR